MQLADLTGRRVVLLGLGRDVRAARPAIDQAGPAEVAVVDDGPGSIPSGSSAMSLVEAARWGEVFVRSPGFPRYQDPIMEALGRGASMTTPLDLWMGTHGPLRTVVAVTGTKGKSTVTELSGVLARRVGLRVGIAGNVGVPVFEDGWDHEAPIVVLEVSSYQAADLHHVPDVAVVTSLSEDHLSWHGGRNAYVRDKLRVVANDGATARRVLVPPDGGAIGDAFAAMDVPAEVVEVIEGPGSDGSIPRHRVQNAALAGAVVAAVGGPILGPETIIEVARASLPGRLDVCSGPDGLLCVDDALASNPSAAAAGLGWLRELGRPTILLLGGLDRAVDPAPLAAEVARWPPSLLRGIALPVNGVALAERCGLTVIESVADVWEGVAVGVAGSEPGGVVVFSPGAPTPPDVGDWQTRSAAFRAALANLT